MNSLMMGPKTSSSILWRSTSFLSWYLLLRWIFCFNYWALLTKGLSQPFSWRAESITNPNHFPDRFLLFYFCTWLWIPLKGNIAEMFNPLLCTSFMIKTYDYGHNFHFITKPSTKQWIRHWSNISWTTKKQSEKTFGSVALSALQ